MAVYIPPGVYWKPEFLCAIIFIIDQIKTYVKIYVELNKHIYLKENKTNLKNAASHRPSPTALL